VPYELEGHGELRFEPDGVSSTIEVPLSDQVQPRNGDLVPPDDDGEE